MHRQLPCGFTNRKRSGSQMLQCAVRQVLPEGLNDEPLGVAPDSGEPLFPSSLQQKALHFCPLKPILYMIAKFDDAIARSCQSG